MRILGIDEAGRGCVLGALYVGGYLTTASATTALREIGVDDSKKLSPKKRERVLDALDDHGEKAVVAISAAAIDAGNLNALEEDAVLTLVRRFRPDRVILDALGHPRTLPALKARLATALIPDDLAPDWVIEPKADANHAACGAASVVAKVTRDRALDALRAQHGAIGSGYPSDPKTRAWLQAHASTGAPWPDFVRTRWGTITEITASSTSS